MFANCKIDVGVIALDQEKAFDRVDHGFSFFHVKIFWFWRRVYVPVGCDVYESHLSGEGGGRAEWSSSGPERHQAGMSYL